MNCHGPLGLSSRQDSGQVTAVVDLMRKHGVLPQIVFKEIKPQQFGFDGFEYAVKQISEIKTESQWPTLLNSPHKVRFACDKQPQ